MTGTLTIATRESPLALWQANHVKDALEHAHPGLAVNHGGGTHHKLLLLDPPKS